MPTSNTEELGRFLKCTVIGRRVLDLAPAELAGACDDRVTGSMVETSSQIRVSLERLHVVRDHVTNIVCEVVQTPNYCKVLISFTN